MTAMPRNPSRSLVTWSAVLLVVLAAHDLSHAFDDGLETPLGGLVLVAVPQWLALAAVMAVIVRGDRARSGLAALVLGGAVTLGFAFVHLLPFATASYWDLHPSAVSWVVAWLPVALGVAVAALGWSEWRAASRSSGGPAPRRTAAVR
jgi:hypothetical protein